MGGQSCIKLRTSENKQLKKLAKIPKRFTIDIGYKQGGGRSIHYTLIASDSTKPLAVFVHGSPGSSDDFLQFAQDTSLLSHYDVLLLDRPGYGYSGFGSSEPSMETQSLILREFLEQFSYNNLYLVGHSLGGPIIARMAMDAPSSFAGLLLVAGSVDPELEPQEKWRHFLAKKMVNWLVPTVFSVSNDELIPAKKELIKMEVLWHRITCPVQIIQGGKDRLVPAGNEDYAETMLVNAQWIKVHRLPMENHFIPFTKPYIVTEALLLF